MLFHVKYKLLYIILPFLTIFLMSQNVFADSLSTASLDLYYIPVSASNYIWRTGMLYNQSQQLWQAKKYQFNTPSVTATGTNAVIHFETNIVASQPANSSGINQSHYVNLDYITNLSCSASNGNLSIIGSSLSYARTPWFSNNNNVFNETLTLYGDIALKGFNKNTSGTITCSVGSDDYAFYNSGSQIADNYRLYFEQNPMSIIWTDSNTDNLLQQQISQTQQLIYQNQQLYEQNNQNTQNIINNQNQNTQDIIKSNQICYENLLNVTVTSFANSNGLSLTLNSDKSITLNGTNNSSSTRYIRIGQDFTLPAGTYTLSNGNSRVATTYAIFYDDNHNFGTDSSYSNNYTSTFNSSVTIRPYLRVASGVSFNNFTIYPQINKGDKALSFIPYGQEVCKNINQDYYDEQRQADNNISNQSSSDINGAENQATTNLIGVLSSFFTQLQSFQATNCNLSLPFPQFIGGTQVVNICQGKDVLGNFITVIGTLAMVTFYIPLAWVLLKMIYNEIRSFTNG